MNGVRKVSKRHLLRAAISYFLVFCLMMNITMPVALSTPSGGTFTIGTGTIDYGTDTAVTVNQSQSVIDWGSPGSGGIDTGASESLSFYQMDGLSNSAVLNRIMSGNPTQFNGTLNGQDMRIFIVNPAGVIFGSGSTVNVNQLVASGLSMSPEDFQAVLDDPANLMIFNGGIGGDVINNGTINAEDSVFLIGKNVINNGAISCPAGLIILAAGDGVYLRQDGSNIFIEVDTASAVTNAGTITADEGKIILAAGDTFSSAIENVGTLAASGGSVTADAAYIENSGTINVDNPDGDGGNIALDASEGLDITETSIMTANAGISNNGANGGKITAKSNGFIVINAGAQFEARGGSYTDPTVLNEETKYNGGRVEIIGESVYVLGGMVNASVTAGAYDIPDPENPGETLTINPEKGPWVIDAPELTIAGGDIPDDNPEAIENTLYEEWIEEQSQAGTNLELVAHSTTEGTVITVEPFGELTGGSGDIAIRTKYNTGGIEFLSDAGGDRTTIYTNDGGNVYMLAGAGGITTGDIETYVPSSDKVTEPGKIRLFTNNYGDIETGELSVSGGSYDEVSIIACGDLTINGSVETITNQTDNEIKSIGQARTCLVSIHGSIQINGSVTVDAHGKYETTADIKIGAGQNITVNLKESQAITATAKTSEIGPANASVQIYSGMLVSGSDISITGGGPKPVVVKADAGGTGGGAVEYTSDGVPPDYFEDTKGDEGVEAHALLEIKEDYEGEYPDCPRPPYIEPPIVPNPPMAMPDFAVTPKYDFISIDVLDNDTGTSDLGILLQSDDTVHGGKVKLNPYGEVTYNPPEDLSSLTFDESGEATDTFTYKVVDEGGLVSDIVTVTVTLTNSLPMASADSAQTLKSSGLPIDVLLNDMDGDELDQLSVLSTSGTSTLGGSITVNPDGTVTYNPPEDLSGVTFDESGHATDTFTYVATDSFNNSQSQVTVTLINNLPVSNNDTTVISKNLNDTVINVLGNDTDGDILDQLSVLSTSGTSELGGTITVNPDGTVTYNLPENLSSLSFDESGRVTDTFTYVATDSFNNSQSEVTVTLVNNLPVANSDMTEISKNLNNTVINVLSNDTDGDIIDQLSVLSTSGTSALGGTITVNPDGTVTYNLPENLGSLTFDESGRVTDTFTYVATDSFNNSQSQVTVTLINQLPSAGDDTVNTNQNQPISSNVLTNDFDPDSDPLAVVLNGISPGHGTLVLNQDGTFTYTPSPGYVGEDSFRYVISDGFNSALGTVMVMVGSIIAAPLPEEVEFMVSGCPALLEWTAVELGNEGQTAQIWAANTLATMKDIEPCQACAQLKAAAAVLQDADGTYVAALTQVINEFASSAAPPSEEQMAAIADAIAGNNEADSAYALAGQYLDALTMYVSIVTELESDEEAVTVAADKYIAPLIEGGDENLAAYFTARLTTLGR
jgi:filamentous hemagglutinin family protein